MKKVKLVLFFLVSCLTAYAQSPNHLYELQNFDRAHYSIESYEYEGEEGFVSAGTLFDNGANYANVLKIGSDGKLQWEVQLDAKSHALDIAFNTATGEIAVTGMINLGGTQFIYISFFDFNTGALIETLSIPCYNDMDELLNGVGTNLIYSESRGVYIVGGYCFSSAPYEVEKAMLLEIAAKGKRQINIRKELEGNILYGSYFHINDITPTRNGYFITGAYSSDCGSGGAANLVATVDYNLDLLHDLSFQEISRAINQYHFGVSAVYDAKSDRIFMLSNNYAGETSYITEFKDISSTPTIDKQYYLPFPQNNSNNKPGFQLIQDTNRPNVLIAAGYELEPIPNGNQETQTWLLSFYKNTGIARSYVKRTIPKAENFDLLTISTMFSPFYLTGGGGAYHPEIITAIPNGAGYAFLNPAEKSNGNQLQYNLNLMSLAKIGINNACIQMPDPGQPDPNTQDCKTSKIWTKKANVDKAFFIEGLRITKFLSDDPANGCQGKSWSGHSNSSQLISGGNVAINPDKISLVVAPNPSQGHIQVALKSKKRSGQLYLINTLGEVLYLTQELEGENLDLNIDISHLSSGIYFLKYTDGENEVVEKVIKH